MVIFLVCELSSIKNLEQSEAAPGRGKSLHPVMGDKEVLEMPEVTGEDSFYVVRD